MEPEGPDTKLPHRSTTQFRTIIATRLKRENVTMHRIMGTIALIALTTAPTYAQKLGKGGTGVDEASEVPRCDRPLGTIALVEERSAATGEQDIPPGLRALVRLAEAQNGGASARVDPLPLLKLLTSESNCFQVVDRGEAFDALNRERELAAGGSVAGASNHATLRAADYLLTAKVLYSDNNAGGSGGGLGSMFPGGLGFKQKKIEVQTILTVVEVGTGYQTAVATGSARKKDLSIIGGGILTNAGVGALGGAYTSTDVGKVTSLALLDAFRKITLKAQSRIATPAAPASPDGAKSAVPVIPGSVASTPRP